MNMEFLKKKPFVEVLFLTLISAIVYLPYAAELTYYLDDWYYIYDGLIAGSNVFHSMFNIDRPARGYFFDIYFSFFGPYPFPYHLGAYLWRLLAGLSAFWLFNILWPSNRRFNFFIALLFILYPGYSWWVSAIEYQPMIASLSFQILSVVFTLKGVQASRSFDRIIYLVGAILTGWIYIALVDYAIGMEAFRFFCVYLLVSQRDQTYILLKKLFASIKAWAWNALIPGGFIFWRLFLFENQRKATDVDLLLSKFREAPISSLRNWSLNLYSSIVNVGFYAWTNQFYLRFADAGFVVSYRIMLVVGIVILLLFMGYKLSNLISATGDTVQRSVARDAIFLGSASLLFGVLPVVVLNRHVNLTIYSHYGLPASLASATLLAGLICYLFLAKNIQVAIISVFAVISVLTHSLIAEKTIMLENAMQAYWWQVSWRVPGLRPDTTLVTLYPYRMGGEDDGFMETANMIYFPGQRKEIPVRYPVSAVIPNNQNTERIIIGQLRKKDGYRSHTFILDYGNVLVLSQPTPVSCVRVIDGTRYLLSESDPENIRLIAPYSKIENVRVNVEPRMPQEFAFGPQPAHNWCYYFEKADLAVQKLDWKEAAKLGDDAIRLELNPEDQAEWFPFLQAYVMLGDEKKVKILSAKISTHKILSHQACSIFNQPDFALALSPQMKKLVTDLFCK